MKGSTHLTPEVEHICIRAILVTNIPRSSWNLGRYYTSCKRMKSCQPKGLISSKRESKRASVSQKKQRNSLNKKIKPSTHELVVCTFHDVDFTSSWPELLVDAFSDSPEGLREERESQRESEIDLTPKLIVFQFSQAKKHIQSDYELC